MDSYYLLIDIGNSFSKLNLYSHINDQNIKNEVVKVDEINKILRTKFVSYKITFVFICSVKKLIGNLINDIKLQLGCDVELFIPNKYQLITSKYKDFTSLGADRWAAILAIHLQEYKNFCVIDCGTAVTVDYVIEDEHKGGLIGPGVLTLSSCLTKTADKIGEVDKNVLNKQLDFYSNSTSLCISNASKLYFKSFIGSVLQHNKDKYGSAFTSFITGGDYLFFNNSKNFNLIYSDNLVIQGLLYIYKTYISKKK
ncbi:MAG: type III pantothenate kinase [Pseudomonadota bacterium]